MRTQKLLDPSKDFYDGVSKFDIINNNAHMQNRAFGCRKTYFNNGKSHCLRCKEELSWCDCEGYWE